MHGPRVSGPGMLGFERGARLCVITSPNTTQVLAMLKAKGAAAPKFEIPEPLTQQPSAIQACMREYQASGVTGAEGGACRPAPS